MKTGGGSSKGGAFERAGCRRLSLWVSKGQRDDLFWRTATSGGRATFMLRTKGQLNLAQAGDLTAIDELGFPLAAQYLVEFKSYGKLQIAEGLVKGTGNLVQFWKRTCQDAATYGKQPVLIAHQNLFPTLLIVRPDCILFDAPTLLTSHVWNAKFLLFEEATKVERPKLVRRA